MDARADEIRVKTSNVGMAKFRVLCHTISQILKGIDCNLINKL